MIQWDEIKAKLKTFTNQNTDSNAQSLSYIRQFVLPECQKGNADYFDDAQRAFMLLSDKQLQINAAAANEALLYDIPVRKLLWLSENFRNRHGDYAYIYACDTEWYCKPNFNLNRQHFSHLTDCQYWATLKLGTFASNGYYRQQCMERLRDADGSLPFLILRVNDWVVQIRERACVLSQERMRKCGLDEFFGSLPMLEKVKNARRRSEREICALETLAGELVRQKFQSVSDRELDEIHKYEIQIRNAVYRFINRNQVLNRDQMERLLKWERTGYGQMLLILAIFRYYGYDSLRAEKYLCSKSAVVRYHTLVCRYEQEHDAWIGLTAMLLDPSRRIRDYAGYILEKRTNMDILAFYQKELDRNVSKTALAGIGEHGTKREIDLLKPYLEDEREQICKAALSAYARLAEAGGEAVYWRFLFDARQSIARQAYRFVQKYGISYGALQLYEAYMQNRFGFMSDYFLRLLLCEPSWKRLPYLLKLYCGGELTENQRLAITAGICSRHMYDSVSKQQAEVIRSLLAQNEDKIPERIREEILFDLKCVVKSSKNTTA